MTIRHLSIIAVVALLLGFNSNALFAQDVDVLDLASSLTSKSSELQKVQDQLKDKREEIKKEAAVVKTEEKKVEALKEAAKGGRVRVTTRGDVVIQKDGREFLHFISRRSRVFTSYEEAIAAMKEFDLAPNSTSVRITDETTGMELKGPPPKLDNAKLDTAEREFAAKQTAYDRALQKYQADKAKYDQDLAAYNKAVDQLNQSLPAAIQDAGTPVPTADQINAPKSAYQVDDLSAVATKYKGQTTKDGKATSFLQDVAKVPDPSKWGKGDKVQGTNLRAGTPIATFNPQGVHVEGKGSHSALYITQNKKGIWVYDQYKTADGQQKPVDARYIRFKKGTGGSPSNDASAYSVIGEKKKPVVPDLPPG